MTTCGRRKHEVMYDNFALGSVRLSCGECLGHTLIDSGVVEKHRQIGPSKYGSGCSSEHTMSEYVDVEGL